MTPKVTCRPVHCRIRESAWALRGLEKPCFPDLQKWSVQNLRSVVKTTNNLRCDRFVCLNPATTESRNIMQSIDHDCNKLQKSRILSCCGFFLKTPPCSSGLAVQYLSTDRLWLRWRLRKGFIPQSESGPSQYSMMAVQESYARRVSTQLYRLSGDKTWP